MEEYNSGEHSVRELEEKNRNNNNNNLQVELEELVRIKK